MEKTALTSLIIESLLISVAVGQCEYGYYANNCVRNVTCPDIDATVIPEKRVFTIYYSNQGAEEIVASCDWLGSGNLRCDEAEGYTCDVRPNKNFSIQINNATNCPKGGQFLFKVARKKPISCNTATIAGTKSENVPQTPDTGCPNAQNKDVSDKNREKRSSDNCKQSKSGDQSKSESESSPSEPQGSPGDYQHQNGANPIAIVVGVVTGSAMVVAVVALLFKRNHQRLQKCWHSKASRNDKDIRSEDQAEAQRL